MPRVSIPKQYQKFTDGLEEFGSELSNLQAILKDLITQYPTLNGVILNDKYELQPFFSIFVNNTQINPEEVASTEMLHNATVILINAVAGG